MDMSNGGGLVAVSPRAVQSRYAVSASKHGICLFLDVRLDSVGISDVCTAVVFFVFSK